MILSTTDSINSIFPLQVSQHFDIDLFDRCNSLVLREKFSVFFAKKIMRMAPHYTMKQSKMCHAVSKVTGNILSIPSSQRMQRSQFLLCPTIMRRSATTFSDPSSLATAGFCRSISSNCKRSIDTQVSTLPLQDPSEDVGMNHHNTNDMGRLTSRRRNIRTVEPGRSPGAPLCVESEYEYAHGYASESGHHKCQVLIKRERPSWDNGETRRVVF